MEANVVCFFGEDTFYIRSKINQLIKQHGVDEYHHTTYDLDETPLIEAINDAMTIPFVMDRKVVVMQNARFLGKEKPKKGPSHDLDALMGYLESPAEQTVLVIAAPIASLDARLAVVKKLKTYKVIECKLKSSQDLVSWASRQVNNTGMSIDQEALDLFIKRVGHSTEFAYLEMRKLLLYAGSETRITKAMIEDIITKNVEDNVYDITNALLEKDVRKALSVYRDLVLHSTDPMAILGIIIQKYREILHVKKLLEDGAGQQDVQSYYQVSSGRAYYMTQNARSVSYAQVVEHLKHLERLDHHIKTGRVDKKTGLELFILSV